MEQAAGTAWPGTQPGKGRRTQQGGQGAPGQQVTGPGGTGQGDVGPGDVGRGSVGYGSLGRGAAEAPEAGHPRRWWILSAVAVGTLVGPLDGSIVNIALPAITASLQAPLTTVEWVAAAYLLVISSLLLMWGRLADLHGHRPVYLVGFATFAVGSALCGAAPTAGWLIVFRMVQAAGAGMMLATGPAIIADAFSGRERARALGLNVMVVAVGLALGPVAGGLITRYLSWRWIFYMNLPIALVGILWAVRVLPGRQPADPKAYRQGPEGARPGEAFDPWGAVLLFVGLGGLLLGISQGQRWGWTSPLTLGALGTGMVGLGLFGAVERRLASPMVDFTLFRDRRFVLANLSGLLNYTAQFTVVFLMPFYLQHVLQLPPDRAGLVMLGFPATLAVSAPLSGYLAGYVPRSWLAASGMGLLSAGIWEASRLSAGLTPGDLFMRLALAGLGAGLFQAPNNDTIMGSVPRERLGVAGGMLASVRNIGMVLGISLAAAIVTARAGASVEEGVRSLPRFVEGLQSAMETGALLALVGVFTSLAAGSGRSRATPESRHDPAAGHAAPH